MKGKNSVQKVLSTNFLYIFMQFVLVTPEPVEYVPKGQNTH